MATTVGNFSATDDTAIDVESPITETLMKETRDNPYWIDAGTKKTTITDTSLVLKPDGSGGVEWGSVVAIDGTTGTLANPTTSWQTITTSTSGVLILSITQLAATNGVNLTASVKIKLSDDTFASNYKVTYNMSSVAVASLSGTITTGQAVSKIVLNTLTAITDFNLRRDSGNLQYSLASGAVTSSTFSASWVII